MTSRVGGRIYGSHVKTPDDRTIIYPMVLLELEGGGASPQGSYQEQLMFIYAYSRESLGKAAELYDEVHKALHHQLLKKAGIKTAGYALEQQRPDQHWNEQVQAWYCRGFYIIRTTTAD